MVNYTVCIYRVFLMNLQGPAQILINISEMELSLENKNYFYFRNSVFVNYSSFVLYYKRLVS